MGNLWESAESAVIRGDISTLERLLRENPKWFAGEQPPAYVPRGPGPDYTDADARSIIVRENHFESWVAFAEHQEALSRNNSPVAQFEAAVDSVISGNVAVLERLLHENPDLIRVRSARKHRATLLHYLGANGVEGFRQKTPGNAVEIAGILLNAGAEADARAGMYGGSTTLGLVATSIHPLLAGVQDALIETLIRAGAAIDGPGRGIVNACLANGRAQAAEFLAGRGAPLDLEGAAGVGRLDLVISFFNQDGSLRGNATKEQMKDGFAWACEYGRTSVVEFLLQRGIEPDARVKHHGQTGLHRAALGAHVETVRLLLEHNAPVDAKDETWGNTPLGWALHGWGDREPGAAPGRYHEVVALLVAAGATVDPEWLAGDKVRADPRMLTALSRNSAS
ncbi:MAG: ankyrin repeat protein [Bryobacterales bacterium]|nr:ankyrin repeat protein [Bryobacterales bacterium]